MSIPSSYPYQSVHSQNWASVDSREDKQSFQDQLDLFQAAIKKESNTDVASLAQGTRDYRVLIEAIDTISRYLKARFISHDGMIVDLVENLKVEHHEIHDVMAFIEKNLPKYQSKTIEELLLWATENQYLEMVQLILKGSYERTNHIGRNGQLSDAISFTRSIFENQDMAKAILRAIDLSVKLGNREMAIMLLMDPRLNSQLMYNTSHAILSAAKGGYLDILKLLLQDGRFDFYPALIWACEQGNQQVFNMIKNYLKFNPNSDLINQAIYEASTHGHSEMVKSLLKNKCFKPFDRTDLEAKMAEGMEWIVEHSSFSRTRIGRIASLHFGGKVSLHDHKVGAWESNITAACRGNHLEIAKMLFKYAQSHSVKCRNKWEIKKLEQKTQHSGY